MGSKLPVRAALDRYRSILLVIALACIALLVAAMASAADKPFDDRSHTYEDSMPVGAGASSRSDTHLSSIMWPRRGQAALVLGNAEPAASPYQQPVPIASVAKVMTALLTLTRYPLSAGQSGFVVTVTTAQARAEAEDAAQGQSVVTVHGGEQLTERQLLEGLLIPSGNNIARVLAGYVAGSDAQFVAYMNAEAKALGLEHTNYTDPSGWDPGTVSTAADQLVVLRQAMRFSVFRQIVSMESVTLPAAGTLVNTNPVIADGFAGKTGSDSAAGACLAFFTYLTIGGHRLTAVGVVLGQWEQDRASVDLAAAGAAAEDLVQSVTWAGRVPTISASSGVGTREPGGSGVPSPAVS